MREAGGDETREGGSSHSDRSCGGHSDRSCGGQRMRTNFVFSPLRNFTRLSLDLSGEGHGGVMQRGGGAGHKVVGVLLNQLGGGLKISHGPVDGVIETVRRGEMDGMLENVGHGVGSGVWLCERHRF